VRVRSVHCSDAASQTPVLQMNHACIFNIFCGVFDRNKPTADALHAGGDV